MRRKLTTATGAVIAKRATLAIRTDAEVIVLSSGWGRFAWGDSRWR